MTVGENIRKYRKEKKLTQKELGNMCGLSEAMIRQYELGIRKPKIETLDKIAIALNTPINLLSHLKWEDYKNTSSFKQIEKIADSKNGIISLLNDFYGQIDEKWISGDYGESFYYLVGKESEQFILYEGNIDTIYDLIKATIPILINQIKDTRPEEDIIKEILTELNNYDLLPDNMKQYIDKTN